MTGGIDATVLAMVTANEQTLFLLILLLILDICWFHTFWYEHKIH